MTLDKKALEVLRSLSVLYVEDDPETREELALMLAPWIGELHVAVDGQAGLDLFKEKRPDIVVTDIQMPRVSGLAMSGEIRRLAPEQPIIVVSAFNDADYLFRAIELGIDQYIPKPVNVERLLHKLAQMAEVHLALKERQRNLVLLEQYRHLVDQSAIVTKLTADGQITYVNDKLCEISGFAAHELIGKGISFLRHSGDSSGGWAEAAQGRRWMGVTRNRTRAGGVYVTESSLVPMTGAHGEVTEIVCLDVDITQIYENYENLLTALDSRELSLREQRHFLAEYKRALEAGTCVCVTDRDWNIISVNKQFEALLGYASEALKGTRLQRLAPDFQPADSLGDIRRTGQANGIVLFTAASGQELQLSVGCVAVRNLGGNVESIIMICQDVTESVRLSQDIVDTQRELLYMMGDVVESRSQETGQHVKRVAVVARFLALRAGLDAETADMIETAAPMHDVGKVGIRDHVLNKQGKLSPEEFEEMKHHARIGHLILGKVERPLVKLASVIAHQHHERWDGLGYPFGLAGQDISIAGRIVAVADVLDALSTERSYKPAWEEEQVRAYFLAQRGLQFDPNLVDVLMENWDTVQALREDTSIRLMRNSIFGDIR